MEIQPTWIPFPSHERKAFNGLVLVIVQSEKNETGTITVKAKSEGIKDSNVTIKTE